MKILMITQKIDTNDDVLGFFHSWLQKFSEKFEKITVICLEQGQYNLPQNVKVLSLGKEGGRSRLKYIKNFYKYIWQERKNYDAVFVHMNQEYIILGGLFWRILGKKIAFWYNHHHGSIITKTAARLSNVLFYTSSFSFNAKLKKAKKMPVGINTDIFKNEEGIQKIKNSILCLGRISPIKKIDFLIEALKLLDEKGEDFILNIVGKPGESDEGYFEKIKKLSRELKDKKKIIFLGRIPNLKTSPIYNQNELFVNLSPAGLFDKTIFEAMACGTLVLASSQALERILPPQFIFKENDIVDLSQKIISILNLTDEEKQETACGFREIVIKNHSLNKLTENIFEEFRLLK